MSSTWARAGSLLAGIVAIAAVLDLRVASRSDDDPVEAAAWTEARRRLESLARPGDVRVSSPLFRAEALAVLGPFAGTSHVPTPSVRASRRVVVLDRTDLPIFGLGVAREVSPIEASHGRLEVRVYEPEGGLELVRVALLDALSPSTLRVERPVGVVSSRCTSPRAEGGFACPNEAEWIYAARRTLRIGGEDLACVWAHPTTGGAILLDLPAGEAAPPGRRLQVSVSAGLTDEAVSSTSDGATVRTEVLQGAAVRGTVQVANVVGLQRGRFDVEPGVPVTLRITTPRDGRRHHCVNAEILEVDAVGSTP